MYLTLHKKHRYNTQLMLLLKSACTDNKTVLVKVHELSLQNLFGKMADVLEKIKK